MLGMRNRLLAGSAAAACAVVAIVWVNYSGHTHHVAKPIGTSTANVRTVAQLTPSSLDPATVTSLAKFDQTNLVDASSADMSALPANSESNVLALAASSASGGTLARVSLARATVPGSDAASSVQSGLPNVIDRLVWVLQYSGAQEPILGRIGYTGPASVASTLVVLMDAKSGEFVSANYN